MISSRNSSINTRRLTSVAAVHVLSMSRVAKIYATASKWCASGPARLGLVVGGGVVGQPFPGGVGPEVVDGTEERVRRVEVELDQPLPAELELESVHRRAVHVVLAPDLVPPAVSLAAGSAVLSKRRANRVLV
jgi:hypothetical protein